MKLFTAAAFTSLCLSSLPVLGLATASASTRPASCPNLLQHKMQGINGQARNLCQYQGKVILVVNTASFCGYTPQYKELQSLYDRYKQRGFVVLGFPANSFANQEPKSNQEISKFCSETYHVSFPMFAKTFVTGKQVNPLFKQLTQTTGQAPLWNFHKYLIDRQGKQVLSFESDVKPLDSKLTQALEKML